MSTRSWASWRVWVAGATLAGLAGCGAAASPPIGPTYEVRGKVVLRDGKPLTRGRVTFVPAEGAAVPASGEIRPDGTFALTTAKPDDGAVPGQYKVRIEPAQADRPGRSRPAFPIKYIDEDSSGLLVTVRPEANRLDPIKLK
jgi:hypothetical protein